MMHKYRLSAFAIALMVMLPFTVEVQAQVYGQAAEQAPVYSAEQIDQMVAPIALYPDQLVSQILMASTYPLEVVQADRWLQAGDNKELEGNELANALEEQTWDPSVKSLVPFPQILSMMDTNLQWTEQLGDAFLGQQAEVMDSIQRLRQMAQASGNLASTPQQTVAVQQGEILILPAQPQIVYVPVYNPTVVYGAWPYPAYQPYYFPPPPRYRFASAGLISFGLGITVVDRYWGWERWDWHRHAIHVDNRRYAVINRGRPPHFAGTWEHNPHHRHGVPYRSAAVSERFQKVGERNREENRDWNNKNDNNRFGGRPDGDRRGSNNNSRPPNTQKVQDTTIQPGDQQHSQSSVQRGPQTNVPSVQRSVNEQKLLQEQQEQDRRSQRGRDRRDNRGDSHSQDMQPQNEAQKQIQNDRAQQDQVRDRIQEQAAKQEEMRRQMQNPTAPKMRSGGVHLERPPQPQPVSMPAQQPQPQVQQQPQRQEQRQQRHGQREQQNQQQQQAQPAAQQQPQNNDNSNSDNNKNQDNRGRHNDDDGRGRGGDRHDNNRDNDDNRRDH